MLEKALENMKKLEYFYMEHDWQFEYGVANLRKVLAKLGLKPKKEGLTETEYTK